MCKVSESSVSPEICRHVLFRRTTTLQRDYILYSVWTRREIRRILFSADPSVSNAGNTEFRFSFNTVYRPDKGKHVVNSMTVKLRHDLSASDQ